AIEEVSRRMNERLRRRGELILGPQSPGDRIYLVKSGTVRIYQLSPQGQEANTAILQPGQLFGTSALVGEGTQPAFAEALEDAEICEMVADEFLHVMSSDPRLAERVIVMLARQLLRLEQQLGHRMLRDVRARLAQALLQLAEDNGGQLPPKL